MTVTDLFAERLNSKQRLVAFACRFCGDEFRPGQTSVQDRFHHARFHIAKGDFELLADEPDGPRFRPVLGRVPHARAKPQ